MNTKQETNLINFIESNLGRPFAWGECDCNTFALEAMDAAYGLNLAEKIKGHYRTERGAIRYRRRSPWGNLIVLIKEAGFMEGQKGFEQTGDLLIVADPGKWEMAHIYLGRMAAAAFRPLGAQDGGVRQFPFTLLNEKPYSVFRPSISLKVKAESSFELQSLSLKVKAETGVWRCKCLLQ